MNIKNPYTILNGELVKINDDRIKSGYCEDYKCPDKNCKRPLTARKGKTRVHHFAHKTDEKCFGLESALHLKSKDIIENLDKLFIPGYRVWAHDIFRLFEKEIFELEKEFKYPLYSNDFIKGIWWETFFDYNDFNLFPELMLNLSDYKIESEVLLNGLKPDIKLTNKATGELLYIEIAVTSFISNEKMDLIKKQKLSILEIDLSKYYKSDYYSPEKTNDLEDYLKRIFTGSMTNESDDWKIYTDVGFNWINLKNENILISNRKKKFIKLCQKN